MAVVVPDRATFRTLAHGAGPRSLLTMYRRLFDDQLTPVLAYRRLVHEDDRLAPSFLLESVVGGDRIGRYSFLGAQPRAEIIARGYDIEYRDHRDPARSRRYRSDDPLSEMHRLTGAWRMIGLPGAGANLPEFVGGWFGFAGYDTVRYLEGEKLCSPPPDDRHLPDLQMGLYPTIVVFDHVKKTVTAITQVLLDEHRGVDAAYEVGCAELNAVIERITRQRPSTLPGAPELAIGEAELLAAPAKLPYGNMAEGRYQQAVRACKQYIAAGDVFQVVISQRFERTTCADPFDIYRALRVINPSPYMFYVQIEGGMLIGSSPEILCRVHDGVVTNRPLAGTRRRGATAAEDAALEKELLADPKERAEHIMLVDLGRNDVGRIAEPGSVALPEIMAVERYSHVMHISSTVTGRLRAGATCWDALRHTLPVGTVSGAPKIRAMQIIDELEPTRRGPYAGAVGHADFAGNMDMAIALRTMVVIPAEQASKPRQWRVDVQAGAGIVADSDPDAEHQETVNKAAALAKAIDVAEAAFAPTCSA